MVFNTHTDTEGRVDLADRIRITVIMGAKERLDRRDWLVIQAALVWLAVMALVTMERRRPEARVVRVARWVAAEAEDQVAHQERPARKPRYMRQGAMAVTARLVPMAELGAPDIWVEQEVMQSMVRRSHPPA